METASELVCAALNLPAPGGGYGGRCGLCGQLGEHMLVPNYRETFTGAEFVHDTRLVCPSCNAMYNDNQFRYANWLCHPGGFLKMKPGDVLATILALDGPYPFVCYTTSTYKKQGWIRLLRALNFSNQFMTVGWDMTLVHLRRDKLVARADLVHWLVGNGVKRGFLLDGTVPLGVLKHLPPATARDVIHFLAGMRRDISWQWVVHFYSQGYEPSTTDIEAILQRSN